MPLDLSPEELAGGIRAAGMGYLRRLDGPHMLYAEGLALDFQDESLDAFRGLPVDARIGFAEIGYGYRIPIARVGDAGASRTTLTPYIGLRHAQLDVSVRVSEPGPLSPILDPILAPLIPRGTIRAGESWLAPSLGLLLEAGLGERFGYAIKLDGAGFGIGPDEYRSAAIFLTWQLGAHWMLAAGYRESRFRAEPGGEEDLSLDLRATGPKVGFAYSF